MKTYRCSNCGEKHGAGIFCPVPVINEKEKYRLELMEKFDAFVKGYGEDYCYHFAALRTKLFGNVVDK